MFNRRHFLGTVAASTAALGLSGLAFGQSAVSERKFIFIFADGGWDPLCVFAPKFGSRYIDMEAGSSAYRVAGHELVHHPSRGPARDYFERYGGDTAIINGLSTRSVSHEVCAVVATTGTTRGNTPDWPSLVAQSRSVPYSMPSLVLGGPSFPGSLEVLAARSGGGQTLAELVSYGLPVDLDGGQGREPSLAPFESLLDRFVGRRASAGEAGIRNAMKKRLYGDLGASVERLEQLKSVDEEINLAAESLSEQLDSAVLALSLGLSRSVCVSSPGEWDSHEDNAEQTPLFNELFSELSRLMNVLSRTRAQSGRRLIEETTVVVYSEMGRTPLYNETGGRDHWPYTSVMLMGAGIRGGQSFGGFDDQFTGIGFDPNTGQASTTELGVPATDLGATLVHLAGLDSASEVPTGRVLRTVLA